MATMMSMTSIMLIVGMILLVMLSCMSQTSLDQDVASLATKVKHNLVLSNQMLATMSRV